MKYILNQVYNIKHVLSNRVIGTCETIEEANQKAHIRGFGDFAQDEKHEDALKTEPMAYEKDGKVVGTTMLCAILYSDLEASLVDGQPLNETAEDGLNGTTSDSDDEVVATTESEAVKTSDIFAPGA